ncbi:MRP-L47-domain-containing protein [Nadsonia fulvescens var. elongata DSM 6958]|uniref:Large ribosomal subunit protein uL29m n=1 Tax=Nadsonia fulvescens var. elongata DSM 6958 TaxID=857566 RepID=A0A1E3PE55_9ASCO|nr:MRP-L47-domain-containing protein [Nadsonia fulvescens var. elongata DSM 6958]
MNSVKQLRTIIPRGSRGFHQTLASTARLANSTKNNKTKAPKNIEREFSGKFKILPPIAPKASNIKVKDDHPLWQFFSHKKFLRAPEDLANAGRPWAVSELRRKSFDDLHTLWYVCLKERNILSREDHLLSNYLSDTGSFAYKRLNENLHETMQRIRHVLAERHHAHEAALESFEEQKNQIFGQFKSRYLEADESRDEDLGLQLERFQLAYLGLNSKFPHGVSQKDVNSIKFISELKFTRFKSDTDNMKAFGQPKDIAETFMIFQAHHSDKGVEEAVVSILEYRESAPSEITPEQEQIVLNNIVKTERAKQVSEAEEQS